MSNTTCKTCGGEGWSYSDAPTEIVGGSPVCITQPGNERITCHNCNGTGKAFADLTCNSCGYATQENYVGMRLKGELCCKCFAGFMVEAPADTSSPYNIELPANAESIIQHLGEAVKHFPEGEPGSYSDMASGDIAMDMVDEVVSGIIRLAQELEITRGLLKDIYDSLDALTYKADASADKYEAWNAAHRNLSLYIVGIKLGLNQSGEKHGND